MKTDEELIDLTNVNRSARTCDLCGKIDGWDFVVSSIDTRRHANVPDSLIVYRFQHVVRCICKDCFIRIFSRREGA